MLQLVNGSSINTAFHSIFEIWEKALKEAASRCEAVLFLVSRDWLASDWCDEEYALARGLNKKLFAVVIDSDDRREGTAAFVEKRPPRFSGR